MSPLPLFAFFAPSFINDGQMVFVVVIFGVLYIARDFIAQHTHYPFLGAKLGA